MSTAGETQGRALLDVLTRIRAIEEDLAGRLGYHSDALLGEPFGSLVAGDSITTIGDALVSLVQHDRDEASGPCNLRTRDQGVVPATLHLARRVGADGALQGFTLAVIVDGQRPKRLPEHLRSLQLAAALVDGDGTLVDVNDTWTALLGDHLTSGHAATLLDLAIDSDREQLGHQLASLANTREPSPRFDVRVDTPTGITWTRMSIVPTNAAHLIVTAEDVSAEKLMHRVLSANEALFRTLTEQSPIGIARITPDLSLAYANPAFLRLAGVDEVASGHLLEIIAAADRTHARHTIDRRIAESDTSPLRYPLETTGDLLTLRVAAVHDEDLGAVGAVVTAEIDHTEAGPAPTAVVGVRGDLVGIANMRTGEILYLNEAARALLGNPAELTASEIYGEIDERYTDEIYPVLRRGDSWTGELEMRTADGALVNVHQTITADLDANGEPEQASAVGTRSLDAAPDHDTLAYLATHDDLTGLPNRGLLLDHLQLALARSARDGRSIGVLFIDLDRFKAVNDTHGHDAGDQLLKEVAARLSDVLRPSDTVARLGGDEFVVLCEDIHGEMDAMIIAARIRAALVDEELLVKGAPAGVTPSIGVALSRDGIADPELLLQQADAAMYRAKQSGRDRVELFDEELRDRNQRREQMRHQLNELIEDRALEVHYQPLVDLATGKVHAVEAFARWPHPERGMLKASDFLDVAIAGGLDERLDRLVLAHAFTDGHRWYQERGDRSPRVHVNVTGRSILSGALTREVERFLALTGMPASKLCIEVSERFLGGDTDAIATRLNRLHELGVILAIDGVGTGATSLPQLQRFHFDMLKVDGSLTAELLGDATSQRLVGAAIAIGRALDLIVAAESIEDRSALPVLKRLGAHVAQGHVFTAPLPADAVEQLFSKRSRLVD